MSLPIKVCKGRTYAVCAQISCFRTLSSKYSCKICHQQHDAKCLKGHTGLASQGYNDYIMVALTCGHVQTAAKEMTGYHLSGKTMPSCCLIWRLLCWHDADGTRSFITRLVSHVKKKSTVTIAKAFLQLWQWGLTKMVLTPWHSRRHCNPPDRRWTLTRY